MAESHIQITKSKVKLIYVYCIVFFKSFVHVHCFLKSKQPVILSFYYKYVGGFFCDSSKASPHVVINAIRMD